MVRKPLLSKRENYLRAVEFGKPEYITCRITAMWPLWNIHRERLESIALRYPLIFPGFESGSIEYDTEEGVMRSDRVLTDPFRCVWSFIIKGYQGQVVEHPLEEWESFKEFEFPDPENGVPKEGDEDLQPWEPILEALDKARDRGDLVVAGMPHGFFFQRLYYLRGFPNLLKDLLAKSTQIYELIDALAEYNLELVDLFLKSGKLDLISFGDDLGLQDRMPISPRTFREFIFPSYHRIFQKIRSRGVHVRLHSDGHVIEVADQLMGSGVDILNIQDRVNGLEEIASKCKGVVCVDLDIDRQNLTAFGKPEQLRKHIDHVMKVLGMREGGLMMISELHPPTPLENIEALAQAMEDTMWLM